MKIVIVGSGKVGYTIAEQLAKEQHDIVVVDREDAPLAHVSDTLDVMVMQGNGASFTTLKEAGAGHADVVIAATSSDEVNMLCCQSAKMLGAAYTIARIRDVDYTREVEILKEKLGINSVINPELATAREISRILRFPAAGNVETFYHERVELVSFRVKDGDFLVGQPLSGLSSSVRNLPFLICAAQREKEIIIPNGSFTPKSKDKLYVIGEYKALAKLFQILGRGNARARDVMIGGGGRIAYYLMKQLPSTMKVKVIEENLERCRDLSSDFPHATVIHGNCTDQDLLENENLSATDAFISLTGRDEDNVIISMYAMLQGVRLVVTKSNRDNVASIASSVGLDSLISPKQITADQIIRELRAMTAPEGDGVTALYRIADGQVEALQFEVTEGTHNLNVPLKDLRLKKGILLAAIVHDGKLEFPTGTSVLQKDDTVVVVSRGYTLLHLNDIFSLVERKAPEARA